jgi:hypothetical protein
VVWAFIRWLDLARLHDIKPTSSSLGYKALDTPRLGFTNRSSSPGHKALDTPRLSPTNSSNSLYYKVLGYSRLYINPTNSPNYTIAGLIIPRPLFNMV